MSCQLDAEDEPPVRDSAWLSACHTNAPKTPKLHIFFSPQPSKVSPVIFAARAVSQSSITRTRSVNDRLDAGFADTRERAILAA